MKMFLLLCVFLCHAALSAFEAEVHWVVCNTTPEGVLKKLGAEVTKKKEREVAYLDTKGLKLQKEGVTLRVRTSPNKIVSTVKIVTTPDEVPAKWLAHPDGKCEWDLRGKEVEFICSLDNEVGVDTSTVDLFNRDQEKFLNDFSKTVDFEKLLQYGPAKNRHLEFEMKQKEFVIEHYKKGKEAFLELSSRTTKAESSKLHSSFKSHLEEAGIELCPRQLSKSDWLLAQEPTLPK